MQTANSAEADSAYDQIPLCPIYLWQSQVQSANWALIYSLCAIFIHSSLRVDFLQCAMQNEDGCLMHKEKENFTVVVFICITKRGGLFASFSDPLGGAPG